MADSIKDKSLDIKTVNLKIFGDMLTIDRLVFRTWNYGMKKALAPNYRSRRARGEFEGYLKRILDNLVKR